MHRNQHHASPIKTYRPHLRKHTNLTITDDRFKEVLYNNIQLEIFSHQKHRNILQKELKNKLPEVTQTKPEPNTNLYNKQLDLKQKT